jgi:hypothetical protein
MTNPGMARTIADLRAMSDEDLVRAHDSHAQHTVVGINYYLEELARRDAAGAGTRIEAMTHRIEVLTWVIAGMTAIILVLTGLSAYFVGKAP